MSRNLLYARVVLAYVCGGHILTSLLALIADDRAVAIGKRAYGADFEPSDQFRYIIRPLGAFQLALAFMQARALQDPWRHRAAIDATLLAIGLRLSQRVMYAPDIHRSFGIPERHHWGETIHMLVVFLLLLSVRFRLESATGVAAAA